MRLNYLAPVFALALLNVNCAGVGGNKLTEARAQNALNRFMSDFSGQATIQGIQELPLENAAKADIKFTNFKYKDQMMGYSMDYSELGTATFSKYNDGRWVLTRVDVPGYRGNHWNVNIPVE